MSPLPEVDKISDDTGTAGPDHTLGPPRYTSGSTTLSRYPCPVGGWSGLKEQESQCVCVRTWGGWGPPVSEGKSPPRVEEEVPQVSPRPSFPPPPPPSCVSSDPTRLATNSPHSLFHSHSPSLYPCVCLVPPTPCGKTPAPSPIQLPRLQVRRYYFSDHGRATLPRPRPESH